MENQKKIFELMFYLVLFIVCIVFLVVNKVKPKEALPPVIPIIAETEKPQEEQNIVDNQGETGEDTPDNDILDEKIRSGEVLLPQNIPYWELD